MPPLPASSDHPAAVSSLVHWPATVPALVQSPLLAYHSPLTFHLEGVVSLLLSLQPQLTSGAPFLITYQSPAQRPCQQRVHILPGHCPPPGSAHLPQQDQVTLVHHSLWKFSFPGGGKKEERAINSNENSTQ